MNLSCLCFAYNFRNLGYKDEADKKPSLIEMVTVQASAGMAAGAVSSVITTPLDTVKTRLQVSIFETHKLCFGHKANLLQFVVGAELVIKDFFFLLTCLCD